MDEFSFGFLLVIIGVSFFFLMFVWEIVFGANSGSAHKQQAKGSRALGRESERIGDYDVALKHYRDADNWQKSSGEFFFDKGKQDGRYKKDIQNIINKRRAQSRVKVNQKVVHGDEVTEIKDSVLNRSNVGSGGKSKAEEIKEIKELYDAGAINATEFDIMKKQIIEK